MTLTTADRVRRHLITTGAVTERGVARAARIGACRDCGAVIVRGLDSDVAALDVAVDLASVDELGELLALTAGRVTYDAVTGTGRIELNPRDQPAHLTRPRRHPVLVEHRCGQPLPTVAATADTRQESDEPPF